MSNLYCAQCGVELTTLRKAIKSQKRVVDLVEPHNCVEFAEDLAALTPINPELVPTDKVRPIPKDLIKLFNDFKFVKKLNELDPKPATPLNTETGDKRSKEHLRKELNVSTAPLSIMDNLRIKMGAKTKPDVIPEGESEPDDTQE